MQSSPFAAGRIEIDGRADLRQAFGIALERQALLDQLLAQIARRERVVGMAGLARDLIEKTDIVVAAGEQPEIVALAEMLLAKHSFEDGALRRQFLEVGGGEAVAEDLIKILVLFDHDDDVVVDRQVRRPRQVLGGRRDAGRACHESSTANPRDLPHLPHRRSTSRIADILGRSPRPVARGISVGSHRTYIPHRTNMRKPGWSPTTVICPLHGAVSSK
jgi:hypothetical protein